MPWYSPYTLKLNLWFGCTSNVRWFISIPFRPLFYNSLFWSNNTYTSYIYHTHLLCYTISVILWLSSTHVDMWYLPITSVNVIGTVDMWYVPITPVNVVGTVDMWYMPITPVNVVGTVDMWYLPITPVNVVGTINHVSG